METRGVYFKRQVSLFH